MIRRRAGLAMALAVATGAPTFAAEPPPRAIYLLMGQSNMSGRGVLAQIPAGALDPDERIQLYGNDGKWRRAVEPLDTSKGQIDKVSTDQDGVGPGLAFAKAMLKRRPGQAIGLVPCAKGGSSIDQWKPAAGRDTLYGSCLARAREAARMGRVAGILWYQGETDTRDEPRAQAWAGKFAEMIDQFRANLGQPDLPLVVVGLGDEPLTGSYAGQFPAWATVQAAQAALKLKGQSYVSAAGLPRNPDQLHINTEAQIKLGGALAKALP